MPYSAANPPRLHDRASPQFFREQLTLFSEGTLSRKLLDSLPSLLAVLNRQRQIVYANQALRDLFGKHRQDLQEGMRPGEALDCIYAKEGDGGCGTGEAC
ncbi:MAG: PAS domain-containing protein, partial [Desulfuromonadales bacterium]|nr:PAS domain-containing protein [Desulfuromonadales bacterium]NIR34391.1 PAS domain-containing protein [Desulfuromonadales bacterium]NIS44361.1 PAS domain-containing protein [Desulfuromonadales bacterium]